MSNELISLQETKIAINNLDFFYGDFHALKTLIYALPKIKLPHLSALQAVENRLYYEL
ncbi:phosphate import ATP-binding protein PstB [Actinobacillus equuli]|nr:phosphate import ATP-binding protein PstB [Actinobacillus equuli]